VKFCRLQMSGISVKTHFCFHKRAVYCQILVLSIYVTSQRSVMKTRSEHTNLNDIMMFCKLDDIRTMPNPQKHTTIPLVESAHTHIYTHTHTDADTYARTHTHTHTHTQVTNQENF
jgi:hypothetical protein